MAKQTLTMQIRYTLFARAFVGRERQWSNNARQLLSLLPAVVAR